MGSALMARLRMVAGEAEKRDQRAFAWDKVRPRLESAGA
jgi:hypothetical protein